MFPLLTIAAAGLTTVPKAADTIADQLGLTDDQREELLPSGKQRILLSRIHRAKFYMGKAGLIESPRRGLFRASEQGLALLKTAPPTINVETLKAFAPFREFYGNSTKTKTPDQPPASLVAAASDVPPEEQIDAAHKVLHSALKAELPARILEQTPSFFERVIVDLLVGMGYGGIRKRRAEARKVRRRRHRRGD